MGDEDRKGDKGSGAGSSPGESVKMEVAEFSKGQQLPQSSAGSWRTF